MHIPKTPTMLMTAALIMGTALVSAPADAAPAAKTYPNCTALNKAFPHGVGRKGAKDKVSRGAKPVTNFTINTAVYNKNTKSDRDHDGIACEKR
ncbi:excalibur calcium-binding domain-containing protein [Dermatophilaceae bacterium Sec6.4]